ncbi:hypothetical protein EVAR_87962_1 [Eumeta japonica]|uniref:Uncharacterized protein n=1 Tax=Eumeta variegata TaxID=151549 RepID=A0A4C1VCM6_EUMVA|nr:hypothetical protein EVAR_87962_1 [Eumeta japonica]
MEAYAARLSLHAAGHRDASDIVKEITETSPKRANKIKKAYHSPKFRHMNIHPKKQISISLSLCLYVDGRFSKHSYTLMQQALVQEAVLTQNEEFLDQGLTLLSKWGCDGSSGHSNYSQRYNTGQEGKSDTSLFAVCLVPLRLQPTNGTYIIWNNH